MCIQAFSGWFTDILPILDTGEKKKSCKKPAAWFLNSIDCAYIRNIDLGYEICGLGALSLRRNLSHLSGSLLSH